MALAEVGRFCTLEYVIDKDEEFQRFSHLNLSVEWGSILSQFEAGWITSIATLKNGVTEVNFKSGLVLHDKRSSIDIGISDELARCGLNPEQETQISADIERISVFLKRRSTDVPIYRPFYETPESDRIQSLLGRLFDWHLPILFGRWAPEDPSVAIDIPAFSTHMEMRDNEAAVFGTLAGSMAFKTKTRYALPSGMLVEILPQGIHLSHPYLLKGNPIEAQAKRLSDEIAYMARFFQEKGIRTEFGSTHFSPIFDEIIKQHVDSLIPLWESKRDPTESLLAGLERILNRGTA